VPTDVAQILAYQQAVRQVRDRVVLFAKTAWRGLSSHRDADIDRLVELIVPQVLAGQQRVASLTDAYIAALAGTTPVGVDIPTVTGAAPRLGAAPREVYRRPAATVYKKLATGGTYDTAVEAGDKRLVSLVKTDLQLAIRAQEQQTFPGTGFDFYRRTLTGLENCALCVIASTQRYTVGDLKPIHPGCDCGCAPVSASRDPGQVLNRQLLDALHDSIEVELKQRDPQGRDLGLGKTDAKGVPIADFTDLIVVREHGEYGPTLTWRADRFTGPDAL
jgi:hypothetical protein